MEPDDTAPLTRAPVATPRVSLVTQREAERWPGWLPRLLGYFIAVGPAATDMYLPAFPAVEATFHTAPGTAQLTLAAWFAGLAVGQLMQGTLSDRIGRRRPLMLGFSVFALAMAGGALAPNLIVLAVLRFVGAIGASAGMVISRAVVRDLADGTRGAILMSRLMLVMGVAPILAPLVGGQVLVLVSWRAIFGGLAIFGALCLAASLWILPETRAARSGRHGMHSMLHDIGALMRDRLFVGYSLALGFAMASMHAYFATSPILFIDVYGVAPTNYGWIFGSNAAGFILFSQINRVFLRRTTADNVLRWASWAQLAIALGLLAVASTAAGGIWGLLPAIFCVIAVLGLMHPNALAGAMMVEPSRAGTASALVGTAQFTICALTAWLSGFVPLPAAMPLATAVMVVVVLSFVTRVALVRRGRTADRS